MSTRRRLAAFVLGSALAAVGASAQSAVPPAPVPRPDSTAEARRREAIRATFERAVSDHLAAESGGPESDARYRRAVAGYRKVLSAGPASAAFYNLGRAEESLGELDAAAGAFRSAAERDGRDRAFYLEAWAEFLERRGQGSEAEKVWERLVLLEPRHDRSFARARERLLAGDSPEPLLDFLWRLVEAKQRDRAADTALAALETGRSRSRGPELLTVVAASLVERATTAEGLRGSDVEARLAALGARPEAIETREIGSGIAELRSLYLEPGRYERPFAWWNRQDLEWAEFRGVPRRDAFRALMRAIGDEYRSGGNAEIAAACYEGAADFGDDPDPVALRRLAIVYVETDRLDRLDALAARHADPSSRLFAAKNQAYREGKLEKVLLYHRTLGQIYGSLAAAGKTTWGSRDRAATAMFQLERAYDVARQLDRETGPPTDGGATRVDADLALLYARGLEATGAAASGAKVRLDAAQTFVAAGDARSAGKLLRGLDERTLAAPEKKRYEEYKRVTPEIRNLSPSVYREIQRPE